MPAKLTCSGYSGSEVGLIFAHPERNDIVEGEHLATRYGRFLKHALYEVGIKPSECYIDYVCPTYPGYGKWGSLEVQDEIDTYRPTLKANLRKFKNLKVILLVGPEVLPHFRITDSLSKTRGFVFDKGRIPLIPVLNPRMIFQGLGKEEVTFMNDLDKAARISREGFKRPAENFIIGPSYKEVVNFIKPLIAKGGKYYCDIEAIGSLNARDRNDITMVGIGDKESQRVLVVPFIQHKGAPYWSIQDEERVRSLLRQAFTACKWVFHNAEYDAKHLNYQEFGPVGIGGDTMLLHHALHPELPHSLDYVTSIYGNIPYWKATLKKSRNQLDIKNEDLWTYNARDVLAMMQIEDELTTDCKEQETYHVYEDISVPMLDVVLEMNNNGLPVDATRLVEWRSELASRNKSILDSMSNLWQIHPAFNWDSDQHLRWLLYAEKPPKLDERKAQYAAYFEEGCKLKKTTKKFAQLQEYIRVFGDTQPFRTIPGLSKKKTKSGTSADDEMRKRIQEAIVKRMDALINMVRKTEDHYDEEIDLAAMRQIIENMMEYAANAKLVSTYTKLHIEPDGRVHPGFRVSGTKTGRLSSYGPNGQNLPPAAKAIFVAPPGWKFYQFDYTNLELVILAYIANIPYLIDVFERGLNVHDENTKRFLGVDKDNAKWEDWRRVMKTYVFGRNYGGSLRGMYRRMLTAIPGLQMTFKQFCELDNAYFRLMPEYKEWYDDTIDILRRTRTLRNAFGRIRIFLGPIDKIAREGLNFPIQGTAADVMSYGLLDFFKGYKKSKARGAKMQLCLSVHDSVVVLAPEREGLHVIKLFKKYLCAPRRIGDHEVPFNGDVKIMDTLKGKKKDEKPIDDWLEVLNERRKQLSRDEGKIDGRAWIETGHPTF